MLKLFTNYLKTKPVLGLNKYFGKTIKMSQSLVNILIVFNKNNNQSNDLSSEECSYLFDSMKTSIKQMFGPNKYTIYNINCEELQSNNCWHLTTALVIGIGDQLNHFLNTDNNSFNFKQINFKVNDLLIVGNQNDYEFNSEVFKLKISSYLTSDPQNNPKDCNYCETNASKVYLLTKDKTNEFVDEFQQLFNTKIQLIDENSGIIVGNEDIFGKRLEVVINEETNDLLFDSKTYFSNLKTERLGHWMAFTEITDTTMELIKSFHGIDGFIAVTNQQTSGRGRTQNEWLSPKGCAMFTLQLSIDLNSNIGQKMAFIQHMAGLSIIRALYTIPGYEELDLVLKWPNDILWRKNKSKLSGVLVISSFINQKFNVLIGCGINVYNREPSVCLNDVIDDYNRHSTKKLDYLKSEEVIARTVTQMELLLKISQQINGIKSIEGLYVKHWIHSGEIITLLDDNTERKVQIQGLDNEGYLLVKDLLHGSSLSLHPDGNRFDIMRNLIIPQKQN